MGLLAEGEERSPSPFFLVLPFLTLYPVWQEKTHTYQIAFVSYSANKHHGVRFGKKPKKQKTESL